MKKVQIFIDSNSEPFEVNINDSDIEKLMHFIKTNGTAAYVIENNTGTLVLKKEHISAVYIEKEDK